MTDEQTIRANIARFRNAVTTENGNVTKGRKRYLRDKECADRICERETAASFELTGPEGAPIGYMDATIPVDERICSSGVVGALTDALTEVTQTCSGVFLVTSMPAALRQLSDGVAKIGTTCECVQVARGLFTKDCPPMVTTTYTTGAASEAVVKKAADCVNDFLQDARDEHQDNVLAMVGYVAAGLVGVTACCCLAAFCYSGFDLAKTPEIFCKMVTNCLACITCKCDDMQNLTPASNNHPATQATIQLPPMHVSSHAVEVQQTYRPK